MRNGAGVNYYARHIGDFIRDTLSLSMIEDGAYNRLIDQCYITERALPKDIEKVYKLARAHTAPERKAVDLVLEEFFNNTAEGFTQKRIEKEIKKYAIKKDHAKKSAAASVKSRREKANKNCETARTPVEQSFNERSTNVERTLNGGSAIPIANSQEPIAKNQEKNQDEKKPERAVRSKKKFPSDFEISETHQRLAERYRLHLQAEFEHFRDHADANGRVQADWGKAFCVWLRNAGTKFRAKNQSVPASDDELKQLAEARQRERETEDAH